MLVLVLVLPVSIQIFSQKGIPLKFKFANFLVLWRVGNVCPDCDNNNMDVYSVILRGRLVSITPLDSCEP